VSVFARASRVRGKPGKLLRAKRKAILNESLAAARRLESELASSAKKKPNIAHTVAPLQESLTQLRTAVLSEGTGSHTEIVAAALADLEQSLTKLVEAQSAKTPAEAIKILAAGNQAYEDARKKAKEAGSDWQL
jgi:vacuolar-type H+-ATPase subunit H